MAQEPLYDDGRIKVSYFNRDYEAHWLTIECSPQYHCLLQRGVLEELSKTQPKDLRTKMNAIDPTFQDVAVRCFWQDSPPIEVVTIGDLDIFYRDVGFALAQARIADLERQVSELLQSDDDIPF